MDVELSRQNVLMAWNDVEFEVRYPSLQEELRVGSYFLRLLLEEDEKDSIPSSYIQKPYEFFNDLYHRFLLTQKASQKSTFLHAMTIVYGRYWEDIGQFNDTRYIVHMLDKVSPPLPGVWVCEQTDHV
ncbi:DNAJC13 [Cordylochernes scorpioides]|uniref:DNAJC13 n=1 Tax=Cordylochernes scorpioides TaxID=51811 RepID=A0ABY6K1C1_9ARAC|nr:DNAJC13 [Cordylochernes scorpioides]